jgi:two-component system response regulator
VDDRAILLVEDNPDDALLIRRALRKGGIPGRVEIARDGAEALDQLFAAGDVPRLVLLDLKLPKVDGWEVLRRLRADSRTADLPVVVFVSGREDHSSAEEVSAADVCINKGVDYEAFLRAVRKLRSLISEIGSLTPEERRALAGFVLHEEIGADAAL